MRRFIYVTGISAALAAVPFAVTARAGKGAPPASVMSLFASGLNNPRGLAFGPDGDLYVAEGGLGGALTTTTTDCAQVPGPVGPYSGGFTASISRIHNGIRSTVVDGLPSSQTSPPPSFVSGIADVAWVGSDLYALEAGAGCSHGLVGTDNKLLKVDLSGAPPTPIANLGEFQRTHPVLHPEMDDFEPDGTWFSMVAVGGALYAVEPNHGEVDRIDPTTGQITRVIDVSATQGHIVPTTIAYKGNFFLGNLGLFPIVPGTSAIFKVTPSGEIKTWSSGLTTVLGLAFGAHDEMYALESMTVAGLPTPAELGAGQIVQIDPNGRQTLIATGFSFPAGMIMGPDGALYVSNLGFGGPQPGLGQIYRVTVP